MTPKTLIKNAYLLLPNGLHQQDLLFSNSIEEIGTIQNKKADVIINAKGLVVLPGVIDTQVHFREPGLTHKECIETGSKAAALGGVVGFFEMPNTQPPTTNFETLVEKLEIASRTSYVDFAFYAGASKNNLNQLSELENKDGCCGIKLFMGSSTGNLLVYEDTYLQEVVKNGKRRMAVHAEDELRLIDRKNQIPIGAKADYHPVWRDDQTGLLAVKKIVAYAEKYKRPVHILHVSSAIEMEFLMQWKSQNQNSDLVSVETLPQFMHFSAPDAYNKLGSRVQMNPPIRYENDRLAVLSSIKNGVVDVLATDHAPHTLLEKEKPYPTSPSGMPGVQTFVSVLLHHVNQGHFTLKQMSDMTSLNPSRLFGIKQMGSIEPGKLASLTVVDLNSRHLISDQDMASRCGWTPYDGEYLNGKPWATIVRGKTVMREGEIIGLPEGQAFEFQV